MRYLIMEDFAGQPAAFLFPDRVDHVDMRDQLPYGKVLGAGDVSVVNGVIRCSGGCAELQVAARPNEDAAVIEAALK